MIIATKLESDRFLCKVSSSRRKQKKIDWLDNNWNEYFKLKDFFFVCVWKRKPYIGTYQIIACSYYHPGTVRFILTKTPLRLQLYRATIPFLALVPGDRPCIYWYKVPVHVYQPQTGAEEHLTHLWISWNITSQPFYCTHFNRHLSLFQFPQLVYYLYCVFRVPWEVNHSFLTGFWC